MQKIKPSSSKSSNKKTSDFINSITPRVGGRGDGGGTMKSRVKLETTYFAMGCFWGPQLLFDKTPGVVETKVGYMGGNLKKFPNPSYEQVCSDSTNYAETTEIIFDSSKITFNALLDKFFLNHNPTTKNRQHLDIGSQYRSAIFYTNEKQKKEAQKTIRSRQRNYSSQIVTEIVYAKSTKFYVAELYHQKYLKKRGINAPTCHA